MEYQQTLAHFQHPTTHHTVDYSQQIEREFEGFGHLCDIVKSITGTVMGVTVIDVGTAPLPSSAEDFDAGSIMSAHLLTDDVWAHPRKYCRPLSDEHRDRALLVLLPEGNYVFVVDAMMNQHDVADFTEHEARYIDNNHRDNRAGAASGVHLRQFGDTSKSHTPVTKGKTTLFVGGDNSGRLAAIYENESGRVIKCPFGCRDMAMLRLSTEQKKQAAEDRAEFCSVLESEAVVFLISQAVLQHLRPHLRRRHSLDAPSRTVRG